VRRLDQEPDPNKGLAYPAFDVVRVRTIYDSVHSLVESSALFLSTRSVLAL
jgi:hypothetical protein